MSLVQYFSLCGWICCVSSNTVLRHSCLKTDLLCLSLLCALQVFAGATGTQFNPIHPISLLSGCEKQVFSVQKFPGNPSPDSPSSKKGASPSCVTFSSTLFTQAALPWYWCLNSFQIYFSNLVWFLKNTVFSLKYVWASSVLKLVYILKTQTQTLFQSFILKNF